MSNKKEMRQAGNLPKIRRFKKRVGNNGRKQRAGIAKARRVSRAN